MRFSVLSAVVALAAIVSANPVPAPGGGGTTNACAGGSLWCCNSVDQSGDQSDGGLASIPIDVMASPQCSPISILSILLGGGTCKSSTVCCQDVGTNGLINIQCLNIPL
ncbi:fungal hydrophobin [Exidia glandulosa HHB12029]|uniref:Hydrophobin n=1 Tax=Exidia glandulosa HHB12029 TaxID=1314781 RepID=A0A165QGL7_EXIGL|nr:fungal hydrophobin [Exidia glandulosa HHB12029]